MTAIETDPLFLPRPTYWAVTILRLGGVLWVLAGWVAMADAGVSVVVFAFFAAVGAIYLGAASGIRRRVFMAYVIALVLAGVGLGYNLADHVNAMSMLYSVLLLAVLLSPGTREYVATPGPAAQRRPGRLSRLDDAVLGSPGSISARVKRALGRE